MTSTEETTQPKPKPQWFIEDPVESKVLPASTRHILETYSHIPSSEVFPHVVKIRDEAYKIHPYPCIGRFHFLEGQLPKMSQYPDIIARVKKGEKLLDMACGFGQAIRQLVLDGVPVQNLYGCDLLPGFIEMGYKLFRDKETLGAKFLTADIFAEDSALTKLRGEIDIVYAALFLHLWGLKDQKEVCKQLVKVLRQQAGSTILGHNLGHQEPYEGDRAQGGRVYRHNVESFKKLWGEIGEEIGVEFAVDAKLVMFEDKSAPWFAPGSGPLFWAVTWK